MNMDIVPEKDEKHRENYASYYYKHHGAKPLPDLRPEGNIKIKTDDQKKWGDSRQIISKAQAPRSYHVQPTKGQYHPTKPPSFDEDTHSKPLTNQSNSHVAVPFTLSPPMITSKFNL